MARRREDVSVKMLRSGFGKQVVSSSLSSPTVGFGTSVRDSSLKVGTRLSHGAGCELRIPCNEARSGLIANKG